MGSGASTSAGAAAAAAAGAARDTASKSSPNTTSGGLGVGNNTGGPNAAAAAASNNAAHAAAAGALGMGNAQNNATANTRNNPGSGGMSTPNSAGLAAAAAAQAPGATGTSGNGPFGMGATRNFAGSLGAGLVQNANANAQARDTSLGYGMLKGIQTGAAGTGTGTSPLGSYGAQNREGSTAAPVGTGIDASEQARNLAAAVALAENSTIRNPSGTINAPALNMTIGSMLARAQGPGPFAKSQNSVLGNAIMAPGAYSATQVKHGNVTPGTLDTNTYGFSNPNFPMARATVDAMLSGVTQNPMARNVNYGNEGVISGAVPSKTKSSPATKSNFAGLAADPSAVTFHDAFAPTASQHTYGTIGGTTPMAGYVGSGEYGPLAGVQSPSFGSTIGTQVANRGVKSAPATQTAGPASDLAARRAVANQLASGVAAAFGQRQADAAAPGPAYSAGAGPAPNQPGSAWGGVSAAQQAGLLAGAKNRTTAGYGHIGQEAAQQGATPGLNTPMHAAQAASLAADNSLAGAPTGPTAASRQGIGLAAQQRAAASQALSEANNLASAVAAAQQRQAASMARQPGSPMGPSPSLGRSLGGLPGSPTGPSPSLGQAPGGLPGSPTGPSPAMGADMGIPSGIMSGSAFPGGSLAATPTGQTLAGIIGNIMNKESAPGVTPTRPSMPGSPTGPSPSLGLAPGGLPGSPTGPSPSMAMGSGIPSPGPQSSMAAFTGANTAPPAGPTPNFFGAAMQPGNQPGLFDQPGWASRFPGVGPGIAPGTPNSWMGSQFPGGSINAMPPGAAPPAPLGNLALQAGTNVPGMFGVSPPPGPQRPQTTVGTPTPPSAPGYSIISNVGPQPAWSAFSNVSTRPPAMAAPPSAPAAPQTGDVNHLFSPPTPPAAAPAAPAETPITEPQGIPAPVPGEAPIDVKKALENMTPFKAWAAPSVDARIASVTQNKDGGWTVTMKDGSTTTLKANGRMKSSMAMGGDFSEPNASLAFGSQFGPDLAAPPAPSSVAPAPSAGVPSGFRFGQLAGPMPSLDLSPPAQTEMHPVTARPGAANPFDAATRPAAPQTPSGEESVGKTPFGSPYGPTYPGGLPATPTTGVPAFANNMGRNTNGGYQWTPQQVAMGPSYMMPAPPPPATPTTPDANAARAQLMQMGVDVTGMDDATVLAMLANLQKPTTPTAGVAPA